MWTNINILHLVKYVLIIQVITEKTPFVGDVIGVSSFGTLNAFSHVILRRNNKVKNDIKNTENGDDIPRLVLVSGRNEENTRQSIEKVNNNLIIKVSFNFHINFYFLV